MDIWKNDNTLSRYKESLPVEDRDNYKKWKKNYDYRNTSEHKRNKFNAILASKCNVDGINAAWYRFFTNMISKSRNPYINKMNKGSLVYEYTSQSNFIDDNDDDFFIDMTYNSEDQDNIVLLLNPVLPNTDYYEQEFKSVINDMIRSRKLRITIRGIFKSDSMLKDHSSNTKKYINLYAEDMINQGYYKFQVANAVKLLTNPDKELASYISNIETDFKARNIITDCYAGIAQLDWEISFVIPYNFGVKTQDTEEMINKSEQLSEVVYNIVHKIEMDMCNRRDY